VRRTLARLASSLAGVLAGVAVAAGALAGAVVGDEPADPPLALDDYCRHLHGERASAYQPRAVERWGCSAWTNGVWRIEPVDLPDACRWQRGPDAVLGTGGGRTERQITCTL
jgi:hypothetical protein